MSPDQLSAPAIIKQSPTISDRIQSTFIDTLVIIVLMFIFSAILDKFENVPDWIRMLIFLAIWGLYEPVGVAMGATIGNYIKGIRVRQFADSTKKINILNSFLRYLVKLALGFISFITIHTNTDRRAIHDIAAGCIMVTK
jgi:uncharacterized RDD family membrane protein YckC